MLKKEGSRRKLSIKVEVIAQGGQGLVSRLAAHVIYLGTPDVIEYWSAPM